MNCDAIFTTPIDFDFGEGYTETWDIVYPDVSEWTLKECYEYLDDKSAEFPDPNPWSANRDELVELLNGVGIECYDHESTDVLFEAVVTNIDDGTIDGIGDWREAVEEAMQEEADDFSPIMNYYYPLPRLKLDARVAQSILSQSHIAVTLVLVGDTPALALTGGGMDLSWDICRAYVLLGYYPPFHFTDLPRYCDMRMSKETRETLDACIESARIVQNWSVNRVERLEEYKSELEKTVAPPAA